MSLQLLPNLVSQSLLCLLHLKQVKDLGITSQMNRILSSDNSHTQDTEGQILLPTAAVLAASLPPLCCLYPLAMFVWAAVELVVFVPTFLWLLSPYCGLSGSRRSIHIGQKLHPALAGTVVDCDWLCACHWLPELWPRLLHVAVIADEETFHTSQDQEGRIQVLASVCHSVITFWSFPSVWLHLLLLLVQLLGLIMSQLLQNGSLDEQYVTVTVIVNYSGRRTILLQSKSQSIAFPGIIANMAAAEQDAGIVTGAATGTGTKTLRQSQSFTITGHTLRVPMHKLCRWQKSGSKHLCILKDIRLQLSKRMAATLKYNEDQWNQLVLTVERLPISLQCTEIHWQRTQ